ncbi:MAG: hypothetical protein ABIG46_01565 [Candidatus Omnitrophota bacterium]
MKNNTLIRAAVIFWLVFNFLFLKAWAKDNYQELILPEGKVVIGITREEAFNKYGMPALVKKDIWYYQRGEKFYIYFADPTSLKLIPEQISATVGKTLEFKLIAILPDSHIKDVTQTAELYLSHPGNFSILSPATLIPKYPGNYQVFMRYGNSYSNPSEVRVEPAIHQDKGKEELIAIDILPFKPKAEMESNINFIALGTSYSQKLIRVRDISQEVQWFKIDVTENKSTQARNNRFYFPAHGIYRIFSATKNLQSYPQEVEVSRNKVTKAKGLKHIMIVPGSISVGLGTEIYPRAYGTFYDNRVEDLTLKVKWSVKGSKILNREEPLGWLTVSPGIAELIAESDGILSLPFKISVNPNMAVAETNTRIPPQTVSRDALKDAKNNLKNIKDRRQNSGVALGRFREVKIMPENLTIPLGESGALKAVGIRHEGGEEDITSFSRWEVTDAEYAAVEKGQVNTKSLGQTEVYVSYGLLKSKPCVLIIDKARLISLKVTPQTQEIKHNDKNKHLEATGYFSDDSVEDMTSKAAWVIENNRLIKIDKGRIIPVKNGETKVHAEYGDVKSLPAQVMILPVKFWLLYLVLKFLFFVFLIILFYLLICYFLVKRLMKKVISLSRQPREFIIELYANLIKLLSIHGIRHDQFTAHLEFAALVDKKYCLKSELLREITLVFEEAKYSTHVFYAQDSCQFAADYNKFINIIYSSYNRSRLFSRKLLTLIHICYTFINLA